MSALTVVHYLIAVILMAILGVLGILGIYAIRPDADNTAIVGQIVGMLVPTTGVLLVLLRGAAHAVAIAQTNQKIDENTAMTRQNSTEVEEIKHIVNSRTDKLTDDLKNTTAALTETASQLATANKVIAAAVEKPTGKN